MYDVKPGNHSMKCYRHTVTWYIRWINCFFYCYFFKISSKITTHNIIYKHIQKSIPGLRLSLKNIVHPFSLKFSPIFEPDQFSLAVLCIVFVFANVNVVVLIEHAAVDKVSVLITTFECVAFAVGLFANPMSLVIRILTYEIF